MTSDANLREYYGRRGAVADLVPLPITESPSAFTDTVKISHCADSVFDGAGQVFESGSENVIDICRSVRVEVRNMRLIPRDQNAVTIKAGTTDWTLRDIAFLRPSAGAQDIDLGNWSDYDRYAYTLRADRVLRPVRWLRKTSGGRLINVRVIGGSPLRIRCLYADRPQLVDCGPVEWVGLVPGWPALNPGLTAAYFAAKRKGLLGATRVPSIENATLMPEEMT